MAEEHQRCLSAKVRHRTPRVVGSPLLVAGTSDDDASQHRRLQLRQPWADSCARAEPDACGAIQPKAADNRADRRRSWYAQDIPAAASREAVERELRKPAALTLNIQPVGHAGMAAGGLIVVARCPDAYTRRELDARHLSSERLRADRKHDQ